MITIKRVGTIIGMAMLTLGNASAQDADMELAKKLANPIASLISVPFQNNFDFNGGPNKDGFGYVLNFQPVVPLTLTDDWTLVVRTIMPINHQHHVFPSDATGLGDITQSFFLVPNKTDIPGLTWGVGPVFLYPSATDDRLGNLQWGMGPTGVILMQDAGWTYGMLANHIWSLTGKRADKTEVNATYLQPFISYTFPTKTTVGVALEATYDWTRGKWTAPIIPSVSQLLKIGAQPISLGLAAKYYVARPAGAPEWGLRFTATLLFPK